MIEVGSVKSLMLTMFFGQQSLSTGTCFLVKNGKRVFVITNRHNFTGRDQNTNKTISKTGGVPDRIEVAHSAFLQYAPSLYWSNRSYPLYTDDGTPRWKEHPVLGVKMDVVALEITVGWEVYVDDYSLDAPISGAIWGPTDPVSVVGFPFGKTAGGFLAIWTTGSIASEPDVDFGGMPVFLVDARTRTGQSGSPVVAHRNGGVLKTAGGVNLYAGVVSDFLGVYSGRINAESDIGTVWKRSAVKELIDAIP